MRLLVVGDSHTQYFAISNQLRNTSQTLRGVRAACKTVSASTIAGVGKVDSTKQLGTSIHKWVHDIAPEYLVLNLGQVDVELGIPFRQFVKQSKQGYRYWLQYFLEEYFRFLTTINLPTNNIIIKGINLPVLCYDHTKAVKYISRIITERFTDSAEDDAEKQRILKSLNDRYPSDIIRTELAVKFNTMLEQECNLNGFGYFDINDKLRAEPNGTIDPKFIPAKFDHHIIDSLEVRAMHWDKLMTTIRSSYWNRTHYESEHTLKTY